MDKEELKNVVGIGKLQETSTIYQERTAEKYLAYATKSRCNGYCRLWIISKVQKRVEYFELKFNREGIADYRSIYGKKNMENVFGEEYRYRITYAEALQLLGDAVRQNYKYGRNLELVEQINSVHLEECWQQEWRTKHKSYVLGEKTLALTDLISLYIQSIAQEDSSLFYSLMAEEAQGENRDLYLYNWYHPLEGFIFRDVTIEAVHYRVLTGEIEVWLLAEASRLDGLVLEIDLSLLCLHTDGGYRIKNEKINEVRKKKC